jgi:hypothetical protein
MSLIDKIPSIVHFIDDIDFDNYKYYIVYAPNNANAVINGKNVKLKKGKRYKIQIDSISGDGLYLLGSPISTVSGLSYSGYTQEMLGGSAFLINNMSGGGSGDTNNIIGQAIIGQAIIS